MHVRTITVRSVACEVWLTDGGEFYWRADPSVKSFTFHSLPALIESSMRQKVLTLRLPVTVVTADMVRDGVVTGYNQVKGYQVEWPGGEDAGRVPVSAKFYQGLSADEKACLLVVLSELDGCRRRLAELQEKLTTKLIDPRREIENLKRKAEP